MSLIISFLFEACKRSISLSQCNLTTYKSISLHICTHMYSMTVSREMNVFICSTNVKCMSLILCTSSTNVKKWESELQTMKNNNTRLQAALEESKQHLSQWKTQLQKYKEDNDSLKKKVRLKIEELEVV